MYKGEGRDSNSVLISTSHSPFYFHPGHQHRLTDYQYWSHPGIRTYNAIHAVYTALDGVTAKYVMSVFLDISGAFDNLKSALQVELLVVTKAYHTVSTDALTILAGVVPLELCVDSLGSLAMEKLPGRISQTIGKTGCQPCEGANDLCYRSLCTGNTAVKHLSGHYMMQFISEHCNLKMKLKDLGLISNEICSDCLMLHTM
ncbi:hypothetical protein PR048_012270 [Dryococelus australis]|uniref:Reverse transcriptase domain-containing protein n=1 Tax=Dryococelus australis TaxID=614101 RepID=A0ABQ9HNV5_9NEOP|nr:hypothetical protein PR048_012270 [Dryococelus australis]